MRAMARGDPHTLATLGVGSGRQPLQYPPSLAHYWSGRSLERTQRGTEAQLRSLSGPAFEVADTFVQPQRDRARGPGSGSPGEETRKGFSLGALSTHSRPPPRSRLGIKVTRCRLKAFCVFLLLHLLLFLLSHILDIQKTA